jgi:hypothetical protein
MSYTSRPDWLDPNFNQENVEEAVAKQAQAYKNAKEEMQAKQAEYDKAVKEIEKGKLARDNYEQMLKDKEDEIIRLQEVQPVNSTPSITDPYSNPYVNPYGTEQDPKKKEAEMKKALQDELDKRETEKRVKEYNKQIASDIAELKSDIGVDEYRRIEPELNKISDELNISSSPKVVKLVYREYLDREESRKKQLADEEAKLAAEKAKGEAEAGGGDGSVATEGEKKYGGQSAEDVFNKLLDEHNESQ